MIDYAIHKVSRKNLTDRRVILHSWYYLPGPVETRSDQEISVRVTYRVSRPTRVYVREVACHVPVRKNFLCILRL